MQQASQRHFHRSTTNKMLAGICGGIGEVLGIDANIVRLVVLALALPFSVVIGLVYLALTLLLPSEQAATAPA